MNRSCFSDRVRKTAAARFYASQRSRNDEGTFILVEFCFRGMGKPEMGFDIISGIDSALYLAWEKRVEYKKHLSQSSSTIASSRFAKFVIRVQPAFDCNMVSQFSNGHLLSFVRYEI